MEGNEKVHPDYQKGFNEGYAIAEIAPEIATTLRNVKAKGDRIEGIKAGIDEFTLEIDKANTPVWLKRDIKSLTSNELDKGDKERD